MENKEKKPYAEPEMEAVELDFSEVMTASPVACLTELLEWQGFTDPNNCYD